jgi:hypothetical protein
MPYESLWTTTRRHHRGLPVFLPVILAVLIGFSVTHVVFDKREQTIDEVVDKTPSQAQAKADVRKLDETFDALSLTAAGRAAVAAGDASRFDVGNWNTSLNLYIASRSTNQASALSQRFCFRYFKKPLKGLSWKVRVHLVDGTVGAECSIR